MTDKETEVTLSCGCIFCDLGLDGKDGFHRMPNGEVVRCPLEWPDYSSSPHPKADQQ